VQRAVAYGSGYIAVTNHSDRLLQVRAREYLDLCRGDPGQVCVNRLCVVREDGNEARRLMSRYLEPVTTFYASGNGWGIGADGSADPSPPPHLRVAPLGMPADEAAEIVRLIAAVVD
jgi:hypothetical protein